MTGPPPIAIGRVLDDEYRHLHGGAEPGPVGAGEVLRRHATAAHAALCLSGGGVRSASFGLGVLQGLARAGVLGSFDYLSTVSGGGYVGGWWSTWRVRAAKRHEPEPAAQLAEPAEPGPLTRLRRLIKFLDPRTGLLSADAWTLGGTILRNLLVNWMVLIPLIAAAAMGPRLYMGVLGLPSQPELVRRATLDWWYLHDWAPIAALIAVATTYAAVELPSLGRRSHGLPSFLAWFLTPVLLLQFLSSVHRYWAWRFGDDPPLRAEMLMSAAAMVLPWMIGGAMSSRWWRPWTWLAAAAVGLAGRFAISSAHHLLSVLAQDDPQVFVSVELPVSFALLFLQFTAFIGLASRDMSDEDREWWARATAWLLIVAGTWLVVGGVVILGPLALDAAVDRAGISSRAARAALGLFTLLAGSAANGARAPKPGDSPAVGRIRTLAFLAAAPAIALLLVVLVSDANRILLVAIHDLDLVHEQNHPVGASLPEDLLLVGGLLAVGLALGRAMSLNPFSLHAMYRDRLVRTFLGASRSRDGRARSPDSIRTTMSRWRDWRRTDGRSTSSTPR